MFYRTSKLAGKLGALIVALLCLGASIPGSKLFAETPVASAQDYNALCREAARAMADELPQIAVYKLKACLAANPPPEVRRAAALSLAQALLATSDGASMLKLLDSEFPHLEEASGNADVLPLFWRAQALANLGRWDEALGDYTRLEQAAGSTLNLPANLKAEASLGRAEALLALRRTAEAFEVCRALADDPAMGPRARLRGAEIALDTGHIKEAAALLLDKSAGDSRPGTARSTPDKQRAYVIGRLRLAQKQTALAEQLFSDAAARPQGLTERLLACNYWGWSQACLEQGKLAEAEDVLESFIGNYPRTTYLKSTLAWLEELYLRNPQLPNLAELRRWAADTTEPLRQAPGLLLLALMEERLGRPDRAEGVFQTFEETFPEHPLRVRAELELASLRMRENHPAEAHSALEKARQFASSSPSAQRDPVTGLNEIDMLAARLDLAENKSADAATLFESIANRAGLTEVQAEAAAFNAVLGWLRASETDRFTATERTFRERFPRSPFGAELALEEGLARAARSQPDDRNGRQRAAAALRRFLRDNPAHPRATEARVALAELAFERPRPNLSAAWHQLASPEFRRVENTETPRAETQNTEAAATVPTPGSEAALENDRAAYLAIWLADTPGPTQDSKQAIALASRFLERTPNSSLAAEVRMKLCEIYFRKEDFSDAETQLELLVEKTPDSPLVESALYLAGLAASRSMSNSGLDNAVLLFEKAARRNGPFKLSARLRQAEAQKRLGNLQDALTLYKDVLTATDGNANLTDADLESRCAALAGQGETLYALGAREASSYGAAAGAFDLLASHTPRASLLWRRQALTQKGSALEKAGAAAAALAAYDEALNAGESGEVPLQEPEWTWFYRAGSSAAHLLESQSQWTAAVAIYKKLAAADGPLKAEYEKILSRSRLEHFIWEN